MKVCATSEEAWDIIKDSPYLGKKQKEAYRLIMEHEPVAQFELDQLAAGGRRYDRNLAKRVSELERRGLVRKAGRKVNPDTGYECYTWETTRKAPTQKFEAKKSALALLRESVADLEVWLDDFEERHGDRKVPVRKVIEKFRKKMDNVGLKIAARRKAAVAATKRKKRNAVA